MHLARLRDVVGAAGGRLLLGRRLLRRLLRRWSLLRFLARPL